MSESTPEVVKEWQGWKMRQGSRTWIAVIGARGEDKATVYNKLMEEELKGGDAKYEYAVMPVGKEPGSDLPAQYPHRMMRPKGL